VLTDCSPDLGGNGVTVRDCSLLQGPGDRGVFGEHDAPHERRPLSYLLTFHARTMHAVSRNAESGCGI